MTDARFTREEQIACIEREIRLRERVYPRWVQAAKMSQHKADTELACMRSILKVLKGEAFVAAGRTMDIT